MRDRVTVVMTCDESNRESQISSDCEESNTERDIATVVARQAALRAGPASGRASLAYSHRAAVGIWLTFRLDLKCDIMYATTSVVDLLCPIRQ